METKVARARFMGGRGERRRNRAILGIFRGSRKPFFRGRCGFLHFTFRSFLLPLFSLFGFLGAFFLRSFFFRCGNLRRVCAVEPAPLEDHWRRGEEFLSIAASTVLALRRVPSQEEFFKGTLTIVAAKIEAGQGKGKVKKVKKESKEGKEGTTKMRRDERHEKDIIFSFCLL